MSFDKRYLKKIRSGSHLLPPPGGEVVRELVDELLSIDGQSSTVVSLRAQLDAAMHKETAMCLELERERGRLDWWIGHAANLAEDGGSFSWYEDGATRFNWQVQIVINGDIRAAIDEAMS